MIERMIITTLIIFIGIGAFTLFKQRHVQLLSRMKTAVSHTPTILYFASDSCAACPSQLRYLEQLVSLWQEGLIVQKVDAEVERETAVKYGIFTLPTTILIDQQGNVREINYGLTHTQKLAQQIASLN